VYASSFGGEGRHMCSYAHYPRYKRAKLKIQNNISPMGIIDNMFKQNNFDKNQSVYTM
jgi:hypothetical protein